jgi:histidinol-phosphatase
MSRQYQDDLELALRATKIADEISVKRFQALDLKVETKPDLTPVTDADKDIEKAFRDLIKNERTEDLVAGEEFGVPGDLNGKHYWVIDPIDGTKNFVRGIPVWATLIALVDESGQVVVGVVSAPALGRTWYASKASGAFLIHGGETKRISVSNINKLSDASLAFSSLVGWDSRLEKFVNLQNKLWRTRGHGDFWNYMLVAEGAVDIGAEPTLSLWDMAAPEIIVREAGGRFTDLNGKPGPHGANALATNGILHEEILKELN